jgi:hypothetical protein
MFLLTRDHDVCLRALSKMRGALNGVACGPIAMLRIGGYWLGWFRARPSDNLHVYEDGLIVGTLSPGEAGSSSPVAHAGHAPDTVHPLVTAASLASRDGRVRIRPFNTTNVFHDGNTASDMQLLIADAKSYRPSAEGVALLGSVGYLPGDLTLFAEVSRISLFHALELDTGRQERTTRFASEPSDDAAMIDRLVSIVPSQLPAYLGLSGGCDSRFVLGILRRSGVRPQLIRLSDDEDAVVERLAEELALPLTVVTEPAADPDPDTYTLMTDAQICHRGGHYSRLRDHLPAGAAFYCGLYADSILKNAFRAAWKVPRRRRDMLERLIEHGLLARMRPREAGLVASASKERLLRFLRERLEVSAADGPFETSKELAAWFHFSFRLTRWTPAHLADLSFFTEIVLPLSDVRALELAIRSSAWSNFHNDRVRGLNQRLLPEVTTGYITGQRARVSPWHRRAAEKLAYEYGSRAIAYWRGRVEVRSAGSTAARAHDAGPESPGFRSYFDRPLSEALAGADWSGWVKRAAVTLNAALAYLEAPAGPLPLAVPDEVRS